MDLLPVIAEEALVQGLDPCGGEMIRLSGQIRSHNQRTEAGRKLLIFIFATELCAEDGRVTALIIPRDSGFLGLGKTERYRIPWCRIECIGEDTVLVKLTAAELSNCVVGGKGKRK